MATIKTYQMPNSSVLRIYSDRELIKVDPEYQRRGDIWTLEKKQLLIDSILNDYDIPKLYFHLLSGGQKAKLGGSYEYAVIDGRQRIQTIYEFIDDSFKLAHDFKFLADEGVKAGGLNYIGLAAQYPKLKVRFDSFTLPIMLVETEELDLIEDMFSRLNEAVPLNAAEKRNALGGPMAKYIRELAGHPFFKKKVKFKNNRLQHYEVAAKLLFSEFNQMKGGRIVDTKKPYLDKMVEDFQGQTDAEPKLIYNNAVKTLNRMSDCFDDGDLLLRAQSSIIVYYLIFRKAGGKGKLPAITRKAILNFNDELEENKSRAEEDITKANFEYLEFDRLSQQGTNDASSIRERVRIMSEYLKIE